MSACEGKSLILQMEVVQSMGNIKAVAKLVAFRLCSTVSHTLTGFLLCHNGKCEQAPLLPFFWGVYITEDQSVSA